MQKCLRDFNNFMDRRELYYQFMDEMEEVVGPQMAGSMHNRLVKAFEYREPKPHVDVMEVAKRLQRAEMEADFIKTVQVINTMTELITSPIPGSGAIFAYVKSSAGEDLTVWDYLGVATDAAGTAGAWKALKTIDKIENLAKSVDGINDISRGSEAAINTTTKVEKAAMVGSESAAATRVFGMASPGKSAVPPGPTSLPLKATDYIRSGDLVDDAVQLMSDAAKSQGLKISDFADDVIVHTNNDFPSFVWRENNRIVVAISKETLSRQGADRLLEGLHELGHLQDIKTLGFDTYYDIAFRRGGIGAIEKMVESRAFRQLEAHLAKQGKGVPSATKDYHERFMNEWK